MSATLQQIEKVSKLSGSAQVREFSKLAKQDKRFDIDSDTPIKEQLESVLHPVIAELESDLAIDNQDNNESVNNNEPVPTGLAGSRGELFYFPATNDYCCQPYNALEAIPSTVFDLVKANFQPISNVKNKPWLSPKRRLRSNLLSIMSLTALHTHLNL